MPRPETEGFEPSTKWGSHTLVPCSMWELVAMAMLMNPATVDGRFDQGVKDAMRRMLSA